jgi:excisionase family DNA binding protein
MSAPRCVLDAVATDAAPDDDPDQAMTVPEAAKYLRVGRNQLYESISKGEIPHLRIGRTIRLIKSAIVRYGSRDRAELHRR